MHSDECVRISDWNANARSYRTISLQPADWLEGYAQHMLTDCQGHTDVSARETIDLLASLGR